MKCRLVLFIYIGLLQLEKAYNSNIRHSTRKRRQDEQWSWGYADITPSERTRDDTPALPDEDPCLIKPPEMPDFRKPGRRISTQKCYEYIWQTHYREVTQKLDKECSEYRRLSSTHFGVAFAIGGRTAKPGEFPHMAAVGWKAAVGTWIFKCGSSLISSKFTLTAAHCTRTSDRDTTVADIIPKIVRLGDKNIIDEWANGLAPVDVNITRIIVHPQYKSPRKYYDIAIMELEYDVLFTDNVQPACLWSEFNTDPLGPDATVTGWGVVETAKRTTSPVLQAAVINLLESRTCDELLRRRFNRHWDGMQEHQLCAGKLAGGVDSCQVI
ncbi:serine protease snake-like [Hyposmocoma kahamanoa]|uniref:serine protease snake-like n=1 Tax=Hyposmocoma kahamanoa TaxID=1477025 RepID=UPI000E6D5B7E|nr:serine protease snake-like [Hyposmocoma kahamanoa]